jgi:hypothetical protein
MTSPERRSGTDRRQSNWTQALDLDYRHKLCALLNELDAYLVAINADAEAAMSNGFPGISGALEDWADRMEMIVRSYREIMAQSTEHVARPQ